MASLPAAPAELRKGPRGGGRDRDKMIGHVVESEWYYAREMGLREPRPGWDDRPAIEALRASMLEILRRPSDGSPLADRTWPPRYAARRIAWHALDSNTYARGTQGTAIASRKKKKQVRIAPLRPRCSMNCASKCKRRCKPGNSKRPLVSRNFRICPIWLRVERMKTVPAAQRPRVVARRSACSGQYHGAGQIETANYSHSWRWRKQSFHSHSGFRSARRTRIAQRTRRIEYSAEPASAGKSFRLAEWS